MTANSVDLSTLRTETLAHPLLFDRSGEEDRARLGGEDRVLFLHGQCTQDVKSGAAGDGGYAFVLDPRGRVLGDIVFLHLPEYLDLRLPRGRGAEILTHLERFVVTRDVHLEDRTEAEGSRLLLGEGAGAVAAAAGLPELPTRRDAGIARDGLVVQRDEDLGVAGFRVTGARDRLEVFDAAARDAGARDADATLFERLRVLAGTPRFDAELDATVLPEEARQKARAVSFEKGCYCGQEVVAKQHFLGKPRKLLVGLLAAEAALEAGAEVFAEGKLLGRVGSAAALPSGGSIGLAVLKGADHPDGRELRIGPEAWEARVHRLPFVADG